MEHDTGQRDTGQLPSGSSQECRSSSTIGSQKHCGNLPASWLGKSEPYLQLDNSDEMKMSPVAVSYHLGDITKHHSMNNLMGENSLQRNGMMSNKNEVSTDDKYQPSPAFPNMMQDNTPSASKFAAPTIAPKSVPFACPGECPSFEKSNASIDADQSSIQKQPSDLSGGGECTPVGPAEQIMMHGQSMTNSKCVPVEGRLGDSGDTRSEHANDADSITNSNCVPVEGRLADLVDNDAYSEHDDEEDEEAGIVILDESTEEEYEESLRGSLDSHNTGCQISSSSEVARNEITHASMYRNDPIVQAAAARVEFNPLPDDGNASLDFEQLLQEADDHSESNIPLGIEDEGANEETRTNASSVLGHFLWQRNPFSSSNRRTEPTQSEATATLLSQRTPVRATRIRHDKYVVEIDIFPSDANNSILETRDAMDIMANIELLHLWFDPVPAVFDATFKDGSGNGTVYPRSSPSNSLEGGDASRQYDGQWVEISSPPLSIPSDSRVYGCLRAISVVIRSKFGFPARIRSMIFVERSCGRIGMTLGPYPDGFHGTMAYHTYTIRMSDKESGIANGERRRVIISDEVRLQRGDKEGFNGARRNCCIYSILRFLLGFLEWVLCFRLYQPDLASYMQQTISSMEKLRTLVERGESAAYAGGELIMDGDDLEEGNAMGTPLLG